MVTEALPEQQTETTPPNDESLAVPNPTPENASPPADQQDESPAGDILAELGLGQAEDSKGDGAGASPDGKAPSEFEGLTPEQIEAKVADKLAAKNRANQSVQERVNYINGIKAYVKDSTSAVDRLADEKGWSVEERKAVKDRLNAIVGDFDQILDYDTRNAKTEGAQYVANLYAKGTVETLGKEAAETLFKAGHQDPQSYLEGYGEAYTKNKGYLSPAAVKKDYLSRKEVAETLEALETAANQKGWSVKALKGESKNNNLSPARGNGSGSQPKNYAEAEAWHASGKWDNDQMRQYKATHSRN